LKDTNYFMKEALKEAHKAYNKGKVPVGAVVVRDGVIIGRGHNRRKMTNDPTEHSEIVAIRQACKKLGSWRLNECDIFVTLESCPMCAGAIIQARIGRVYIEAMNSKAGCAGSTNRNLLSLTPNTPMQL
jgi:tRNA(adenine34) deaminase